MNDLDTDNAVSEATTYSISEYGMKVIVDHREALVAVVEQEDRRVLLCASEALGLLDVLLHEKPLLVEWAGKDAEP